MIPFIQFKEHGKHYLLQRAEPHYLAEILTYPDPKALCYAQLPGYMLFVTFKGTLVRPRATTPPYLERRYSTNHLQHDGMVPHS
jgi:hypothetical protein